MDLTTHLVDYLLADVKANAAASFIHVMTLLEFSEELEKLANALWGHSNACVTDLEKNRVSPMLDAKSYFSSSSELHSIREEV